MDASQIRDLLTAEIVDEGPSTEHRFDDYGIVKRLLAPRAAVREALSSLADAGILNRARRTGTSMANSLFYWALENSATEVASLQVPVSFRTEDIARMVPPESVARELTGRPDGEVTRIIRSSMIQGRAAERWTIWTTIDLPPSVFEQGVPTDLTWYGFVAQVTGHDTLTMQRRAVNYRATADDVDILDVALGDPLRFVSRSLSLPDGTVIDRGWGRLNSQLVISSEKFTIRL